MPIKWEQELAQNITGNLDFKVKISWDFGISQNGLGLWKITQLGFGLKINWDLGLGTP